MSESEIIFIGISLIAIAVAVIAFIRTPKERWFGEPGYKEEGVDYAPEYTKRERIEIALKNLAWAIPVVFICEFWLFDWFAEYSNNANCYKYGSINGVHLVFYGLFVFMPLLFAIILCLTEGRRSIKVFRLGQNPLPNEKVFSTTSYKYGLAAKAQPIVVLSVMLFLIGLSVWGGFQAHDLTRNIKPCDFRKNITN